jgi:hypothetical protein
MVDGEAGCVGTSNGEGLGGSPAEDAGDGTVMAAGLGTFPAGDADRSASIGAGGALGAVSLPGAGLGTPVDDGARAPPEGGPALAAPASMNEGTVAAERSGSVVAEGLGAEPPSWTGWGAALGASGKRSTALPAGTAGAARSRGDSTSSCWPGGLGVSG